LHREACSPRDLPPSKQIGTDRDSATIQRNVHLVASGCGDNCGDRVTGGPPGPGPRPFDDFGYCLWLEADCSPHAHERHSPGPCPLADGLADRPRAAAKFLSGQQAAMRSGIACIPICSPFIPTLHSMQESRLFNSFAFIFCTCYINCMTPKPQIKTMRELSTPEGRLLGVCDVLNAERTLNADRS